MYIEGVEIDEVESKYDKEIAAFKAKGGKVKKLKPGKKFKSLFKQKGPKKPPRKEEVEATRMPMSAPFILDEGTWALPDTQKKYDKLMKLMQRKIPAGKATKILYNFAGDDALFDAIGEKEKEDKNGDVRPMVNHFLDLPASRKYMKKQGIKGVFANKEEVEIDEANLNDYAAKFKQKMGKTTYQTMTDWVDGIGKLTKRENKTLKRVLKPFTEGVVIRKGPPQIKFMWKRDKRVTESNKAKSLAALRTALAVSKYKKAGGKVEKQPPGIAKGALMFRGKGGTTRDDDEENKINRGVMSWKKLRHGKKKK